MGLFSSKTKIYVSSVVYSLGGDYADRTDFLKFLVINNTFAREPKLSMSEAIISGSLTGPAMDMRSFYRWSIVNYAEAIPDSGFFGASDLDIEAITGEIPVGIHETAWVSEAVVGAIDYSKWSYGYMLANHSDLIDTEWNSTISSSDVITIIFEDTTTETFTPSNFHRDKIYLYIQYAKVTAGGSAELVNTGVTYGPFSSSGSLPDITDFTFRETVVTTGLTKIIYNTVTTDVTYSDSTPSTSDTTTTETGEMTYDKSDDIYFKYLITITDPSDETKLLTLRDDIHIWTQPRITTTTTVSSIDMDIGGGVIMTTTTTTVSESFVSGEVDYYYRTDSYAEDIGSLTNPIFLPYAFGDGNTVLDAMEPTKDVSTGYYPIIPLRIENKMVNEAPYDTTLYTKASKAYKKATHGKLTKLLDEIVDNPSLGDIDYSFIHYGVPLNTKSNESRRYIYEFLREMINQQLCTKADHDVFQTKYEEYITTIDDMSDIFEHTIINVIPPLRPTFPVLPKTTLQINNTDPAYYFYNFRISWSYAEETFHTGLGKVDAKVGDLWIIKNAVINRYSYTVSRAFTKLYTDTIPELGFKIYFQYAPNAYKVIEMIDMTHNNLVYRGKSVLITSHEALDDTDDSGFIIPLHYGIFKRIPIMQQNQVALECGIIIFNCFVVKKTKWYQSLVFKILIIIAIVVITAIVAPSVLLGGGGLLGANTAIGSAVGLSGISGAIFGAVTNAIVASIVTQMISTVAVSLLGDKLGAIVSAVLGFIIANPTLLAGGSVGATAWSNLFRPENLLALTSPIAGVYTQILQGKTANIYADLQTAQDSYEKQMEEIQKLTEENLGSATDFFNPMALTDIGQNGPTSYEASDAFLNRTLLTGSDIAGMTFETVYSFVSVNLTIDLR